MIKFEFEHLNHFEIISIDSVRFANKFKNLKARSASVCVRVCDLN